MVFCDANIILRYLLRDIETQFAEAKRLIEKDDIFILNEVAAEVVYVLIKVYSIEKKKVCAVLKEFYSRDNVHFLSKDIILGAINIFSESSMDFVDCILCSYAAIEDASVASFDAKVNRYLEKKKNSK